MNLLFYNIAYGQMIVTHMLSICYVRIRDIKAYEMSFHNVRPCDVLTKRLQWQRIWHDLVYPLIG